MEYLLALPLRSFLRQGEMLAFSLGLSEAFASLARYVRLRSWDLRQFLPWQALVFVISPLLAITVALAAFLWSSMWFHFRAYLGDTFTKKDRITPPALNTFVASVCSLTFFAVGWMFLVVALNYDGSVSADHSSMLHLLFPLTIFVLPDPLPVAVWTVGLAATLIILLGSVSFASLLYLKRSAAHPGDFGAAFSINEKVRVGIGIITALLAWMLFSLVIGPDPTYDPASVTEEQVRNVVLFFGGWVLLLYSMVVYANVNHAYARLREGRIAATALQKALSRKVIAETFWEMKTVEGRQRFVELLARRCDLPLGEWPSGLPYVPEDPADSMLAQLEERWLGLTDRWGWCGDAVAAIVGGAGAGRDGGSGARRVWHGGCLRLTRRSAGMHLRRCSCNGRIQANLVPSPVKVGNLSDRRWP